MDKDKNKLIQKVNQMAVSYEKYRILPLAEIPCEIYETLDYTLRKEPDGQEGWKTLKIGDEWGEERGYAWLRGDITIPPEWAGKELWLKSGADATECLLFLNGKPSGIFDYTEEVTKPWERVHAIQPLMQSAIPGKTIHVALEAYAGHKVLGTMPFEDFQNCDNFYPNRWRRQFAGMTVVEIDHEVDRFISRLKTMEQYYHCLDDHCFLKWKISNIYEELFVLLPQMPGEYPDASWRELLGKANRLLDSVFECRLPDGEQYLGYAGLVGHSHLDAAWQWPVHETIHKAARTFSNALRVMDKYPDYTFIQSSVAYIEWMRQYYPDIFEGIRKKTDEGQWEPNGGSWIECDGNMTGGECLIRQFVKGQRYLRTHLNYQADTFWQPDTFGYSAAIPQIMKGCELKYFLTTKLSWNETNQFPYDTFLWKGIDGTAVLTHFNLMHCWPDIEQITDGVRNQILHKDVSDHKLIAYGFGDGGGGPSYDMVETAKLAKNLPGIPRSEFTTVSRFMQNLEKSAHNLPIYDGELYLELHRGTLTQMHDIKRSNRKAEVALRTLEMADALINVQNGKPSCKPETDHLYETLLLNQFHDILPGTSLQEVHELAIKENYSVVEQADTLAEKIFTSFTQNDQSFTFFNPLSWEYTKQLVVDDNGLVPDHYPYQRYVDINGQSKLVIGNVKIPPMAAVTVDMVPEQAMTCSSAFQVSDGKVTTPFAIVETDECGAITSMIDIRCHRQLVKDPSQPLNTLLCGEDVPYLWDNWDIDYTQKLKMQPQRNVISRTLVSDGPLQLRYRTVYAVGQHSTVTQDTVFYADDPRIDFETVADWKDPHHLLKTQFCVNMKTDFARHEIQFGYVDRSVNENTSVEKAQFEFCNHKYTDLFDARYGVALLNDCKYGISVLGSDMRLSLHKGGCRPDPTGDVGIHQFTYSLLPHNSSFSAPAVVRPGYELNIKPTVIKGRWSGGQVAPLVLENDNLIIETVKPAEEGNGIVIRLYDSEGVSSNAVLRLNGSYSEVWETNMLEDNKRKVEVHNGMIEREFVPFEIVTLKLVF